jgi:hypothetical protein
MIRLRSFGAAGTVCLGFAAGQLVAAPAAADTTDGTYGRLQGDLDLSIGAGPALARGGPTAAAYARAMYMSTVGLYAAYNDALGSDRPVQRSASAGIGLRPLFLPRWGYDLERGPATLDLALDSFTLDVGALFAAHRGGTAGATPGFEIAIGTEVPLLGRAAGPWIGLRGALGWRADELASRGEPSAQPTRASASLTLSWHTIVDAHIVDARDRSFR